MRSVARRDVQSLKLAVFIGLVTISAPRRARAEPLLPPNLPEQREDPGGREAVAPLPESSDTAALRAELGRQAQAIESLRLAQEEAKRARENPLIRLSGYAQIDWTIHNQLSQNEINFATGEPLNRDRFTLRRGHLRAVSERNYLSVALELDANTQNGINGAQVRPIDAEVSLQWPEHIDESRPYIAATLGLMKIPFGFEVPELDEVRPFLERSTVMRALFPGEFDVGARFRGGYRFVQWAIAAMNGNPLGDEVFPTLAPSRTKDLVGRVGVRGEVAPGIAWEAGVSGETGMGFHEGTPPTKDQLIWRDENGDGIVQATEIDVIAGSSATASQEFHRFAIGADARLMVHIARLGELALRAEIVRGQNLDRGVEFADPVGASHDLRELGWYAGATQELTQWAMVGIRYDQYNPDQDASTQRALYLVPSDRTYRTLALMAMLRYDRARLVLEYDKNDNALGRDPSGAPTTLKSDALTMRGQVKF